ncbi:hypothetical protein K431DRAFT_335120 [Polychaeton citri CBS 116435]|uniref:Uncharacterized protein n=1 Tax=Polychaeton citri CBS 116435 TaxID=1314669 RepID=A0A9P4PZW1_9PEZI|nr:hypothetical protein K431DRAFT_335120 [Polychaeton citri CBS 116435]
MFNCKTCIRLHIACRVESPTLAARRFVGPVAYGTSRGLCSTLTVAVARLSTPTTNLRFHAREGFVPESQTPEALHRSTPGLEDSGEGRLSVHSGVLALQQPGCVCALGHSYNHRSVCLWQILPAEPRNFRSPHLILLF